jgi:N-acetylglucosamine-6-phosphate deacetylase
VSELFLAFGPQGFGTYKLDGESDLVSAEGEPQYVVAPGLVDLHFHGAFGVDFMSATSAELSDLGDKLAQEGYEKVLLTTVTASLDDILRAFEQVPDHPVFAGVHLEGPFISPKHPGAQPQSFILDFQNLDPAWNEVFEHPLLQVVTLAPEIPGALSVIESLAERGVRVSMGHTDATYSQAMEGVYAGATHSTHTYNAMRPLHHREPSLLGCVMTEADVYCELIYDRIHVSPPAADVLIRTKGMENILAVSDSTMASRLPSGQSVLMWGLECITAPGEIRLASNGALAGSAILLSDAFRNLSQDFDFETAIMACCVNPRSAMGWDDTPERWLRFDLSGSLIPE